MNILRRGMHRRNAPKKRPGDGSVSRPEATGARNRVLMAGQGALPPLAMIGHFPPKYFRPEEDQARRILVTGRSAERGQSARVRTPPLRRAVSSSDRSRSP